MKRKENEGKVLLCIKSMRCFRVSSGEVLSRGYSIKDELEEKWAEGKEDEKLCYLKSPFYSPP